MDNEFDYKLERYKTYIELRNKYIDQQYDQGKQFDQYIFLLSSGAFGVSFSFISEIVKEPTAKTNKYLIIAWSLIICSIMFSLISYLFNNFDYKKRILIEDVKYKNEQDDKILKEKIPLNKYEGIAGKINIINLVFLLGGFAGLLIYVALNILGGTHA